MVYFYRICRKKKNHRCERSLYLSRSINFHQRNRLSSIHRLIQYPNNIKIKDAGAFAACQKRKTHDVYVNHHMQSLAAHQPINSCAFLFIWLCKHLWIADSQQVKQKKAKPKGKSKRPKKTNSRKKGACSIWQSPSETIFTCHSGRGNTATEHVLRFGFQSLFHSAVLSDSEERRTMTMKKK